MVKILKFKNFIKIYFINISFNLIIFTYLLKHVFKKFENYFFFYLTNFTEKFM